MDTPRTDLTSKEELPWKARLEEVNKRFPVKPRLGRRKPARPQSSPVYRGDMVGPRWRSQKTRAMVMRERFGGSNVYLLAPSVDNSVGKAWERNYQRMMQSETKAPKEITPLPEETTTPSTLVPENGEATGAALLARFAGPKVKMETIHKSGAGITREKVNAGDYQDRIPASEVDDKHVSRIEQVKEAELVSKAPSPRPPPPSHLPTTVASHEVRKGSNVSVQQRPVSARRRRSGKAKKKLNLPWSRLPRTGVVREKVSIGTPPPWLLASLAALLTERHSHLSKADNKGWIHGNGG